MISFKQGVRIFGLTPEILWALDQCNDVFDGHGENTTVTSGRGDVHSRQSLHYTGCAIDIRTRHIDKSKLPSIVEHLNSTLGKNYDVILEGNHLHIEYQPRNMHAYPSRHPYD